MVPALQTRVRPSGANPIKLTQKLFLLGINADDGPATRFSTTTSILFSATGPILLRLGPTKKWPAAGGSSAHSERTRTAQFPIQSLVRSDCCCGTSTNTVADLRISLG